MVRQHGLHEGVMWLERSQHSNTPGPISPFSADVWHTPSMSFKDSLFLCQSSSILSSPFSPLVPSTHFDPHPPSSLLYLSGSFLGNKCFWHPLLLSGPQNTEKMWLSTKKPLLTHCQAWHSPFRLTGKHLSAICGPLGCENIRGMKASCYLPLQNQMCTGGEHQFKLSWPQKWGFVGDFNQCCMHRPLVCQWLGPDQCNSTILPTGKHFSCSSQSYSSAQNQDLPILTRMKLLLQIT